MKTFIYLLALAVAVNGGLVHHAPLPLSLSHGSTGLVYAGGLSGGLSSGLTYGSGVSHGLALSGGHGLAYGGLGYGLGGGHQLIKVIQHEPAPLLVAAPVHHSTQLVKVIHQHAPAPAPLLVHAAPAPLKIVKVLHQAPTGW